MNCLKLLFLQDVRYPEEIFCKKISELTSFEKEELAQKVIESLNDYQKVNLLNYIDISEKEFASFAQKLGYYPSTRIKNIPELEIENPNHLFYNAGCRVEAFSPAKSGQKDYYYDKALQYQGDLYVKVNVPNNHPFMQARARLQKKKEAEAAEKAEKRRLKQIEKAKKLLEQNS